MSNLEKEISYLVSRTEKISSERESDLLEESIEVGEQVQELRNNLLNYRGGDENHQSEDFILKLRGEILSEFESIDVDTSLYKEWAEDLRESPHKAGLSDGTSLGKVLRFSDQHQNYFRNRIVASNLKLVVSQVKNFLNRGLSYMDLVQEGNLGLLEAIKGFEYEKGYKFSTYATWWIRQAMQRAIHQKKGVVNIPVHRREEMAKVFNAREQLRQELKEQPDRSDIAEKLNWSEEKVEKILSVNAQPLSLDSNDDDDDRSMTEEIDDSGIEDVEEPLQQQALKDTLEELLQEFDWRERQLVRMRFGLDDGNERTLKEIGQVLDLSKERVRQIEKNTLKELSNRARDSELKEFLSISK